ncbi:alba protein [Gregarina niphandrodes]|uniref:Alba protein n=1 Tax=Gregarina niphandrodes TaxID=110365 RepID=A0A023B5S2_GRENI|nr:alba protein [Gregarina niphandrodes]EZG62790.1 alba protein [Gregarina niphandrodes]|eukprot:XP_011130711.1 alba protein [Gregarina niphandrodes]
MSSADKRTDMQEDAGVPSNVGRIQVSASRLRRFYVFAARRLLAANPQMTKVHITALGSAVTHAIGIAHELQDMKVSTISDVQTFYQPLKPSEIDSPSSNPEHASNNGRSIARILIVVDRNPAWTAEETDIRPNRRNSKSN